MLTMPAPWLGFKYSYIYSAMFESEGVVIWFGTERVWYEKHDARRKL
jgi:hypothetical protein